MKKKLLSLRILAVILAVALCLAGCGGGGSEDEDVPPESPDVSAEPTPAEDPESEKPEKTSEPVDLGDFSAEGTISETVIWDRDDVVITATGLEYSKFEVKLNLKFENNSGEELQFSSGRNDSRNAINGYMIEQGSLTEDVPAGKKADASISFSLDELRTYGILEIADIQLTICIWKGTNDYIYTDPMQIKTQLADSYDYEKDTYIEAMSGGVMSEVYGYELNHFAEEELYNEKNIKIVSQALITNNIGQQCFLIELENGMDTQVCAVASNVRLNGLSVHGPLWSSGTMYAGARGLFILNLSNLLDEGCRELMGLTEIGSLSFDMEIVEAMEQKELIPEKNIVVEVPGKNASFDSAGTELYNENDIRIVFKGLLPPEFDNSDRYSLIMLVENNTGERFQIGVDSMSANNYMIDSSSYERYIAPGVALYDVYLYEDSLSESGIDGVEALTELELVFEIMDTHYKTIAEPTVKITF